MKRLIITTICMMAAMAFAAAPTVTDVVAKQRYPWGLVDITCKVRGLDEGVSGSLSVEAVFPDSGKTQNVNNYWVMLNGIKSKNLFVDKNDDYHLLWDAKADLGEVRYTNMVVRVTFLLRDKVQLWEGGPYWATMNIGAEKPEDYGYYFWWGDTVGYKREDNKWVASDGSNSNFSFTSGNMPTYNKSVSTLQSEGWITADGVLAPEHDAAHKHRGGDWRIPTEQELADLNNNCDWTRTTMNGVNGYIVRGKGDYASNSIFLPFTGYGHGASLVDAGSFGAYWSSVPNSDSYVHAWSLAFGLSYHSTYCDIYRGRGRSVRPLQGFIK